MENLISMHSFSRGTHFLAFTFTLSLTLPHSIRLATTPKELKFQIPILEKYDLRIEYNGLSHMHSDPFQRYWIQYI